MHSYKYERPDMTKVYLPTLVYWYIIDGPIKQHSIYTISGHNIYYTGEMIRLSNYAERVCVFHRLYSFISFT